MRTQRRGKSSGLRQRLFNQPLSAIPGELTFPRLSCKQVNYEMEASEETPALKRYHDGTRKDNKSTTNPFILMFEFFRAELDEHHDRRERVIKASRDITASSKKMFVLCPIELPVRTLTLNIRIFSMQR